jgi:competence protein ComFC
VNLRKVEREIKSGILACYDYRDPVIKGAIWRLKYYRSKYLGAHLGSLLYQGMIEDVSDIHILHSGRPILVVPTPISKGRQRERGYNQALAIAQGFCASDPLVFELRSDIVSKKTNTLPQARIKDRRERLRNIQGAFEVAHTSEIRGRIMIVIDDVTTTGATMNELKKILKTSGARKVIGMALAH